MNIRKALLAGALLAGLSTPGVLAQDGPVTLFGRGGASLLIDRTHTVCPSYVPTVICGRVQFNVTGIPEFPDRLTIIGTSGELRYDGIARHVGAEPPQGDEPPQLIFALALCK